MPSRSPHNLQATEKIATAVFRCDECYESLIKPHTTARQRERKSFKRKHAALYARCTNLTWKQLREHVATVHAIRKANNQNFANESVNMSESISAKISRMRPLPDAQVARRIYEKLKHDQQLQQQQPIEAVAAAVVEDMNREKNEKKKENEVEAKKNKRKRNEE